MAGFGAIIVALLIVTASVSRTYSIYHNYSTYITMILLTNIAYHDCFLDAPLKIYGDLSHTLEADDCWEGTEQSTLIFVETP